MCFRVDSIFGQALHEAPMYNVYNVKICITILKVFVTQHFLTYKLKHLLDSLIPIYLRKRLNMQNKL